MEIFRLSRIKALYLPLTLIVGLVPKGRRESVDRQVVRSIIGLKHKLCMSVWSSQVAGELHKPVRRRFEKRLVFSKQIDDIWAADLVDMSSFSRSNKGYKFL